MKNLYSLVEYELDKQTDEEISALYNLLIKENNKRNMRKSIIKSLNNKSNTWGI